MQEIKKKREERVPDKKKQTANNKKPDFKEEINMTTLRKALFATTCLAFTALATPAFCGECPATARFNAAVERSNALLEKVKAAKACSPEEAALKKELKAADAAMISLAAGSAACTHSNIVAKTRATVEQQEFSTLSHRVYAIFLKVRQKLFLASMASHRKTARQRQNKPRTTRAVLTSSPRINRRLDTIHILPTSPICTTTAVPAIVSEPMPSIRPRQLMSSCVPTREEPPRYTNTKQPKELGTFLVTLL